MSNWIICPVRNGLEFTSAAYKTFLSQDVGTIRVIIIDNGSTDQTPQWAYSQNTETMLYWPQRNPLSVGASWNRGLRFLFDKLVPKKLSRVMPYPRIDHALVVNNDVLLRPDTYRWLLEDGGQFVTAVGNQDRGCIEPPHKKPTAAKRPHPDFSCFLIRRECWETVGPFDENEIAFYEDNLYHVRMWRKGIRAESIDLPFYHYGSATIKMSTTEEQIRIADAAGRNRERFYARTGCYPATPEYEELFSEANFGLDKPILEEEESVQP